MDSRCMSMRFPVLDRIKMSAALPHPVPPLSYTESKTYDAGVFPVLNNFKSHRPTDRQLPSSPPLFDRFYRHLGPILRFGMDFVRPRFLSPRNISLRFIEKKRKDHSTICRTIPRPVLLSSREIGYWAEFGRDIGIGKRYLSLKNTCIVRWKRTNRAFHSWWLRFFDFSFVPVSRNFPRSAEKFARISRQRKTRRPSSSSSKNTSIAHWKETGTSNFHRDNVLVLQ